MRKYSITFEAYSDDIVIVEIKDNESGKILFEDETYELERSYRINDTFDVTISFDSGWLMGISNLNEEEDWAKGYTIRFEPSHYSPNLIIESDEPFTIPDLYGTKEVALKAKLKSVINDRYTDDENIDRVMRFLKNEGII